MSGSPQEGPSLSGAGFPPGGAGAGPGRVHLLRGGVGPRDSTPEGGGVVVVCVEIETVRGTDELSHFEELLRFNVESNGTDP